MNAGHALVSSGTLVLKKSFAYGFYIGYDGFIQK